MIATTRGGESMALTPNATVMEELRILRKDLQDSL